MDGQKFYLRKRYMVKKSAAAAAAKTKYCYSVTIDGCKCECNSAKAVVELINERLKCPYQ